MRTRAAALIARWPELAPERQRGIIHAPVERVEVQSDQVRLVVRPDALPRMLEQQDREALPHTGDLQSASHSPLVRWQVPFQLRRVGRAARLIVGNTASGANPGLLKLLARAHRLQRQLLHGEHDSIAALAAAEESSGSYVTHLLRLAWLAPDITHAILEGRHPAELTPDKLIRTLSLPAD